MFNFNSGSYHLSSIADAKCPEWKALQRKLEEQQVFFKAEFKTNLTNRSIKVIDSPYISNEMGYRNPIK